MPSNRLVRNFLSSLLGRSTEDPSANPEIFRHSLGLLTSLDQIQNYSVNTLSENYKVPRTALFVLDEDGNVFSPEVVKGFTHPHGIFDFSDKVVTWLNTNRQPLNLYAEATLLRSFKEGERERWLSLGVDWVFPLLNLNRLQGFILFGGRKFSKDDVEHMRVLTNYVGAALGNARVHKKNLEVAESFHRAERLAMAGQLAAAAAHEIRNPLTSIRSSIQYVIKGMEEGDRKHDLLSNVLGEVDRINKVVEGLLTSVRPQVPAFERVDLVQLIDQLVEPFRLKDELELDVTLDDNCRDVVCDPDQFKQVLLNLLQNADQVLNSKGKLEVTLKKEAATSQKIRSISAQQFHVKVKDDGPGIKENVIKKIFDPFFTTRMNDKGTGLGLSICRGIIEKHGGELTAFSIPGQGASFDIILPENKL